jgi:hypothetical protein
VNIVRKPLRRVLRKTLALLSRWALKKHKPQIVAVVGEGKTAIAREAIYRVVKSKYPVRRNIEAPDAEFVLPLIILGTHEYPHSYLGWLRVLIKAAGQLLIRPPHKHFLVLEIGYLNKEIFDYFWELTHPSILVVCGEAPYLSEEQTAKNTLTIRKEDDLKPFIETALNVAKIIHIDGKKAKKSLTGFSLPAARIRILKSKSGGTLVDATHQYYPPSEEALDEVLEALPGRKIPITPSASRARTKEKDLEIKKGEVGVILGPKKKMWPILQKLTKTPWW